MKYTGKYQDAITQALIDNGNKITGWFERYDGEVVAPIEFSLFNNQITFTADGKEYSSPSVYIKEFFEKFGSLGNSNSEEPATAVLGGSYHVFRRMIVNLSSGKTMEQVMETYGVDMTRNPDDYAPVKREFKKRLTSDMHARIGIFQKYGNDILRELCKTWDKTEVCNDADYLLLGQFEEKYGLAK